VLLDCPERPDHGAAWVRCGLLHRRPAEPLKGPLRFRPGRIGWGGTIAWGSACHG